MKQDQAEGWRVEDFGQDCMGNISGYRVVRGYGFHRETNSLHIGNIYVPGSFVEMRTQAEQVCSGLNF